MLDDRRPGLLPEAVDDVEHAPGQPGLAAELGEAMRGQRSEFRGLAHRGVAGGEGRGDLPAQEIQRQVPRRDQARYAAWSPKSDIQRPGVGLMGVGPGVQDGRREEAKVLNRPGDVHRAGERERLTGVDRLEPGELVDVGLDQVGEPKQDPAALRGGRDRPPPEGPPRRRDGGLDVDPITVGHSPAHGARRGVEVVEVRPPHRLDRLAVDEVPDVDHGRIHSHGSSYCTARRPPSTGRFTPLM